MFRPLMVTFHLDGAGVMWDPHESVHLDGLLAFAAAAHHCTGEAPGRSDTPQDIPIPVGRWYCGNVWGWRASALFPDGVTYESLQFWRKKFRQNRIELTAGSPNLTNATYREWNMPMHLTLCHTMVAWVFGERREIRRELRRNIRHIGRKPAMGKGVVNDITVDECDEDWSVVRDGRAQRFMPEAGGVRVCRPRPPYWNNVGRLEMCDVGDPYNLKNIRL